MIRYYYFESMLIGALIIAVPAAYMYGKLSTIVEKEHFKIAAIECVRVAQEQGKVLEAAIRN
jgi:hypothetical protein